ncbi:hypothetical protein K7432_017297, partial [Basidiobolus ranarum]
MTGNKYKKLTLVLSTESTDCIFPQSFGNIAKCQDTMDLPQNATLVKPVSPDKFEAMLLDVNLGYSSTDGSISQVEEEDDGFVMDSLLLASICPLIILTLKEAALIIEEWRAQANLSNQ